MLWMAVSKSSKAQDFSNGKTQFKKSNIMNLSNRQIKLGYQGNYVHVTTQPKGCYAYVGNINRGPQELNLQTGGCFSSR